MTNTGGDRRADFAVVPDFEAAFRAGWAGSRTQIAYLAALGPSREHSHRAGGEVRCISEMVVLPSGIYVPDLSQDTI